MWKTYYSCELRGNQVEIEHSMVPRIYLGQPYIFFLHASANHEVLSLLYINI